MSKRRNKSRNRRGDGVPMGDELLAAHRELQLLRAAGTSASSRREKRRPKPVRASSEELAAWVETRHDKREETAA